MKITCENCSKKLEPVFGIDETTYQFENALWITLHGGYGMFIESRDVNGNEKEPINFKNSDYEVVICHDCAHELCEQVPWIEKLIQPYSSHAHFNNFWEENPDHEGWDNPKNNENQ